MSRGYQPDFYTLHEPFRDAARRRRKGEKIRWALATYAGRDLRHATCLDVGCSAGLMTGVFADLFARTIGLDYDETALAAVDPADRERVTFVHGDAMRLPLPDASVDVVVCAQVYEHVPDDTRLFAEITRVLRPGGVVFFSGPNWLFPIELHYFLPFLHWLPPAWADAWLRLTGQGDAYYERSRSYWGLQWLLAAYEVEDIGQAVIEQFFVAPESAAGTLVRRIPPPVWRFLLPLLPNFNWVLHKPPE
jgi:SAM-dependent methyltransferase